MCLEPLIGRRPLAHDCKGEGRGNDSAWPCPLQIVSAAQVRGGVRGERMSKSGLPWEMYCAALSMFQMYPGSFAPPFLPFRHSS